MASALHVPLPEPTDGSLGDAVSSELRTRQQCIAEITEMIHVRYFFIFLLNVPFFCVYGIKGVGNNRLLLHLHMDYLKLFSYIPFCSFNI